MKNKTSPKDADISSKNGSINESLYFEEIP